jgi:hypothetical protein
MHIWHKNFHDFFLGTLTITRPNGLTFFCRPVFPEIPFLGSPRFMFLVCTIRKKMFLVCTRHEFHFHLQHGCDRPTYTLLPYDQIISSARSASHHWTKAFVQKRRVHFILPRIGVANLRDMYHCVHLALFY